MRRVRNEHRKPKTFRPQQFFLSNLWIKNRTVRFRSVERREREREGKMKNLLADGTSFLEAGERKGKEGKIFNRYQSLVHQHRENTCDLVAYISLL